MTTKNEEAESDAEVFVGMQRAIDEAKEAQGLTFAMVVVIGQDGYISYLRSMEGCQGRDLREAAGLLLGYANKLTGMADRLENEGVYLVDRPDPEEKPS